MRCARGFDWNSDPSRTSKPSGTGDKVEDELEDDSCISAKRGGASVVA